MDRRDVLQLFGAAAVPALAGAPPERLFALARAAHAPAPGAAAFRFLDPHQAALVTEIAELILPATDTPGARAAGVGPFIDVIAGEWYTEAERAAFTRGLADVDARATALFGRGFLECDEAQRTAILTGMAAESRAMPRGAPQHIFARLKNLTLYGYYTSEIGVTRELGDVLIPGAYDGCAPLRLAPAGGE